MTANTKKHTRGELRSAGIPGNAYACAKKGSSEPVSRCPEKSAGEKDRLALQLLQLKFRGRYYIGGKDKVR
jgi:hypothetical protein